MITVKKTVEKKEITCPHCGAILEYEDGDVHDVYEGFGFACPMCGEDVVVEENIYENICYDTPIYPDAFFSFENACKITNEKIQEWCDRVFNALKDSEDPYASYSIGSGDTIVFGNKYEDGEIAVRVAKNYEEFIYCPEDI